MVLNIALQAPKICLAIIKEHFWLKQFVKKNPVDVVVSDNRYGLFSKKIKTIFITHQLHILAPHLFLQKVAKIINHTLIRNFDYCWVPDNETYPTLSGSLSKRVTGLNLRYLGPLSRFSGWKAPAAYSNDEEGGLLDALIVLSGPEPQRTLFENRIVEQGLRCSLRLLLIQGLTGTQKDQSLRDGFNLHSSLTANELWNAMGRTRVVICRSGYSSVMDLAVLGKKVFFVPTPGQTEQEYLARFLHHNHGVPHEHQDKFQLQEAVLSAKPFSLAARNNPSGLDIAVKEIMESQK